LAALRSFGQATRRQMLCCFRSQGAGPQDQIEVYECSRPGCKQVTWNGQPGEYCSKACKEQDVGSTHASSTQLSNRCIRPGCKSTSWNGQAGQFCSKRCRDAVTGVPLCLHFGCGKPTWNGQPNEYCSKRCRDQQAPSTVPVCLQPGCSKPTWNCQPNDFCSKQCRSMSPLAGSLCLTPGCGKRTWNGQPNEFCSKQCRNASSVAPRCLRVGCSKPTWNGQANEFCSRPCRDASGTATTAVCLKPGCGKPTWNGMPGEFCSRLCRNSFSMVPSGGGRLASMCVLLRDTDPRLGAIKQHFEDKWDTSRGTPTPIRAVYEVFGRTSLVQAFRQGCDNIGNVPLYKSGTNPGNVQRRFHGTPLRCAFQGSSCNDPDCSTCRIINDGFDLAKLGSWSKNKGNFGGGIYFTSMSSTAKGYGIDTAAGYSFQKDNWRDADAGNSVLLVNIACGRVETVTDKCAVPIDKSKYDSRKVDKTSGADELVIFDEQSVLVRYVIVF